MYDGHGSTRLLTDNSGSITDRYSFDAYGELLGGNPTVTTPATTSLLYSGEQFDTDLQQQYLRARYYDQNVGRFNRLDPFIGESIDPQSLHKYAYAHGDPISGTDPSGLRNLISVLTAVGIILNLTTLIIDAIKLSEVIRSGTPGEVAVAWLNIGIDLILLSIPFINGPGQMARALATSGINAYALALGRVNAAKVGALQIVWAQLRLVAAMASSTTPTTEDSGTTSSSSTSSEGPGSWAQVNESMPARARRYQKQISGKPNNWVYLLKRVKFDGFNGGFLIDAKGLGYANFAKNGVFRGWFKYSEDGGLALVKQARRQIQASGGTPVRWHVAEREAVDAIKNLFDEFGISGIDVVHTPAF